MVYFSTRKKNKKNYIIHYSGLGRRSGNALFDLPSRRFPLDPTLGTCLALQSKQATRQCKNVFLLRQCRGFLFRQIGDPLRIFIVCVNDRKCYKGVYPNRFAKSSRRTSFCTYYASFVFFFIIFAENPVQTEVSSPLKNLPEQSAIHLQLYHLNLTHTAPKLHHSTS